LKRVTVTGVSNVTGYINPIHEIAKIVHKHNVKLLVDGAQLVPHMPVDMKPYDSLEHIDYLVFSAHKLYAPFGGGVLIGPKATFEKGFPAYTGGGCVRLVTHDFGQWAQPPAKDEAGTPNVMSIVALVAAIKTLKNIGMQVIEEYERSLAKYALDRLKQVADIETYACKQIDSKRLGIIPFNIKGIHHNIVAKVLSLEDGIAVRNGMFCAHPYAQKLLKLTAKEIDYFAKNSGVSFPGMVRISFGLYNNHEEIERLIYAINKICMNKDYYVKKYLSFH
ncbi:MAG TPA: aminotransferase, partial [Clostridiales bacterium]|nr:aminotransferase [Clostridiales bacterium]